MPYTNKFFLAVSVSFFHSRCQKKSESEARADSSPDPSSAREISRGFAKSFSPENSFRKTESVLKPHALPEYLEGRTPKEKHPFLFQKKFHLRQIRNARSVFSFGVAAESARRWRGVRRAYDSVSLHHALRACALASSRIFDKVCSSGIIKTLQNQT